MQPRGHCLKTMLPSVVGPFHSQRGFRIETRCFQDPHLQEKVSPELPDFQKLHLQPQSLKMVHVAAQTT